MRDPLYVTAVMVMVVLVGILVACVVSPQDGPRQLRNAYHPYSVETRIMDR